MEFGDFRRNFGQCVRRHVDAWKKSGGKPFFASPTQLYNALKYASCILVTVLSWLDHLHADANDVPEGYDSWGDVPIMRVDLRPLKFFCKPRQYR